MSYFEEVFRKIFPNSSPRHEVIYEELQRSESDQDEYNSWLWSKQSGDLLGELENAYRLKQSDIESQLKVHLLNSNYSNGLAVSYNSRISHKEFRNLFDLLKDQTLKTGYKLTQGDRRILARETYEETIEKWYLKPERSKTAEGLLNQLYGNVIIELIEIDRAPSFIRLMVNIYQDRLYTKALSFDEFIDEIFRFDN